MSIYYARYCPIMYDIRYMEYHQAWGGNVLSPERNGNLEGYACIIRPTHIFNWEI